MKKLNIMMFLLFLVSGISIIHAQDSNAVANLVSEDMFDNKETMVNLQDDNQEIMNDEGYGVDDKEYYGSEGNVEIEDGQLDDQILNALENEMSQERADAIEGNGTK